MSQIDQIRTSHVIFDLDGTLIDSAPSILASMQIAFEEVGIQPVRQLTHDLIGPPLAVAMSSLLTDETLCKLPILIDGFRRHYDESGYRESRFYDGTLDMLQELRHMGLRIYIATNKRILPTRKIIQYFGWNTLFDGLYSLDYFHPTLQNKKVMLHRLCKELPGISGGSIYVGDRAEDADAAKINHFRFLWASWGYGALELETSNHQRIANPLELTKIIKMWS
jgi:phosphoglycolate phosphatase